MLFCKIRTMTSKLISPPNYQVYAIAIPAALIAVCTIVYWPGLDGIFLLDDYGSLQHLGTIGGVKDFDSFLRFVFGNNSGPTGRPVAMLSFLLDDQYWPGTASNYKYNNLMIHIICGLLILLLVYKLSRIIQISESRAILLSAFCSAFWLLHPLNVSTTLYVIQRMAQLMTLFSLMGVLLYCYGRLRLGSQPAKAYIFMSTGVGVFGCLAFFSKETGVLLVFYILVVELTLLQKVEKNTYFKYWFGVFVILPIALLMSYFIYRGFFYSSYGTRDFTLFQRLLTESRIVISYLYSILIPPISGTGLVHDDIQLSTSLTNPVTTILSIFANLALIVSAIRLRKRHIVFSFSVLWFYCGHIMESTFIPLELYFEHRNYLPMVGPIFGMVYYISHFYSRCTQPVLKKSLAAFPVLLVLASAAITYQSARIWENPAALFATWAQEHPNSLRAQRIFGQFQHINNQPENAIKTFQKTYAKHPYDLSLPIEILNIACLHNVDTQYKYQDLKVAATKARYTDGLWGITKNFIDNVVKKKCTQYTLDNMINLLTLLAESKNIKLTSYVYAKLLFLQSDLHVLKRQLNPAMELLDEAYKYQRTVIIPLRQVELLVSAKLYQHAQKYLELAKQADEKRGRFMPSEMNNILKWEKIINRGLKQQVS